MAEEEKTISGFLDAEGLKAYTKLVKKRIENKVVYCDSLDDVSDDLCENDTVVVTSLSSTTNITSVTRSADLDITRNNSSTISKETAATKTTDLDIT